MGLHHIAILCSKGEQSVRFYEALGFQVYETHVHPLRVTSPEAYGLRHLVLRVLGAQIVRQSLTMNQLVAYTNSKRERLLMPYKSMPFQYIVSCKFSLVISSD